MNISDLQPKQGKVELTVNIMKKENPREFNKDGRQGKVCNFIVADKTGSIKLSLWNEDIDRFKVGDKVKINNGYVSEWQGEKQLSTGKFGSIEKVDEGKEIDEELDRIEKKDSELEKLDIMEKKSFKNKRDVRKLDEFEKELKELEEIEEVSSNLEINDSIPDSIEKKAEEKEDALTLDELEESLTISSPGENETNIEDEISDDEIEEMDLVEEEIVGEDEEK